MPVYVKSVWSPLTHKRTFSLPYIHDITVSTERCNHCNECKGEWFSVYIAEWCTRYFTMKIIVLYRINDVAVYGCLAHIMQWTKNSMRMRCTFFRSFSMYTNAYKMIIILINACAMENCITANPYIAVCSMYSMYKYIDVCIDIW